MKTLDNTPAISIIIPVYNSEKYIKKNLLSIYNQTFKNFEVIIVNDGSTDNTLNIINSLKHKFEKLKIINIENQGVSVARNIGISHSSGKYLSFIDSDDFISPLFLETLYQNIITHNADISCCNYYSYYPPRSKIKLVNILTYPQGVYSSKKIIKSLIKDVRIHYYMCNKLWKKDLFIDHNITFPKMCFEDISVSIQLFYYAKNIVITSKYLYYYTYRNNSLVNSINLKKINDYIDAYKLIKSFLIKTPNFNDYKFSYNIFGYRLILSSIILILKMNLGYTTTKKLCGKLIKEVRTYMKSSDI